MSEKRFGFFDGGNVLRRIDDTMLSQFNDNVPTVQPTEHQKVRSHQLEKHIDTQDYPYTGAYEATGLSEKQDFIMPDGAEIVTHLIGSGWLLRAVVYHVKRVGAGTLTPSVELNVYDEKTGKPTGTQSFPVIKADGSQLVVELDKPGFYIGYAVAEDNMPKPRDEKDAKKARAASAPGVTEVEVTIPGQTVQATGLKDADGKAITGTISVPQQTVKVEVPRGAAAEGTGAGLPVPLLTTTNGFLVNTFTAAKDGNKDTLPFDACIGVYLDLTEFFDEHPCNCAPTPCETEFPDPECMSLN